MDFQILGAMRVLDGDGADVRIPAGRERSLLALLLVERGRVVPVDRIVDALWGAAPPDSAGKAVQGYVSHLRRLVPGDALVEGMLDLMQREHRLDRREALALASVVVDLHVTQLVNGARGIHARLPHDALR